MEVVYEFYLSRNFFNSLNKSITVCPYLGKGYYNKKRKSNKNTIWKGNFMKNLKLLFLFALAAAMGFVVSNTASANITGAIFATNSTDSVTNGNKFDFKTDVYLDGGPHHEDAAGLPDGYYYVQVTSPGNPNDPETLLGSSNFNLIASKAPVHVTNGSFDYLYRLWDIVSTSNGTQGYDDTLNNGGVYKVWVTPADKFDLDDPQAVHGFIHDWSKTDNFKVGEIIPSPTPVDLEVTKTAFSSFTRTYEWGISKDVDKTLVKQIGGSATFNYTVDVSQTGLEDSDWVVTGIITVSNPNISEVVVDVIDEVDNGGAAEITNAVDSEDNAYDTDGTNVTVPAAGWVDLYYTVTYSSEPTDSEGTNTATATWDSAFYDTPDDSAFGTADFDFTTPDTLVNNIVTITDSYAGLLGTLTATEEEPYASATFTYARTVSVPAFNCAFYDNTATIVETGQTANQEVEVCGPAKTGALTMGYWQNKNGQAIITGANQAALKTYLTQFNPFKDFTTGTAATYVTNIIKAANASGAAMNAMLKAQMLATALDVYFWNQIGAPVPIGNVEIDLTKINKPIGSATFENVSSAFGGATSKTISDMLAYAASQSNVGGSAWYGQVKATQELAKDAFDAINNQKAFAP
jgi:hypothetical protein